MSDEEEKTGILNETQQSEGGADITPFPIRTDDPNEDEEEKSEYLVDIETHQSILVVALNVEEAAAKALLGNYDEDLTIVGHDVHVCVHSGISDNECDHEEESE